MAIVLAAKIVADMADDHEQAGLSDPYWPLKVEMPSEVERRLRNRPNDRA